jgi:hypothetical protein
LTSSSAPRRTTSPRTEAAFDVVQPRGAALLRRGTADGAIREYGISLGWVVCFLLLAIVARYVFDCHAVQPARRLGAEKCRGRARPGRALPRACHHPRPGHVFDPQPPHRTPRRQLEGLFILLSVVIVGAMNYVGLGGQLKTGQSWTGQNRPVESDPKHECSTAFVGDRSSPHGSPTVVEGDSEISPRSKSRPSCAKARRVIPPSSAQEALRSLCRRVRQLRGPQVRTWA